MSEESRKDIEAAMEPNVIIAQLNRKANSLNETIERLTIEKSRLEGKLELALDLLREANEAR